jgi:mono/diheme cytochrome c family protein
MAGFVAAGFARRRKPKIPTVKLRGASGTMRALTALPRSIPKEPSTMGHRVFALFYLLACLTGAGIAIAAEPSADAAPADTPTAQPAPLLPPARAYGELSAARVEHGRYLTLAGGCMGCHTREGGAPFAGGRAIETPFGTLYTPNITPAAGYGIGDFSDADFLRALKHGLRPDGQPYWPTLPYRAYARVPDDDLLAIKDYLFSLAPSSYLPPETRLGWPFDTRAPLFGWQDRYLDTTPFAPNPAKDAAWNRGAYLVEGLGHCRTCHSPRQDAAAQGDGALQDTYQDAYQDTYVDGWYAPGLAADLSGGLDALSAEALAERLQNAGGDDGIAASAHQGVAQLAASDLQAMARYLKDQPPQPTLQHTPAVPEQLTEAVHAQGRRLYEGYCASCHQSHGRGLAPYFPALAGNETVTADAPDDSVRTLLLGAPSDPAEAYSPHVVMPSFGSIFTDRQVAALASYVRASWGNGATAVTAEQVSALRER